MALVGRGAIDEAIAQYQKALDTKPHFAEAHNNLGNVLAGRGQFDEASTHYQQALKIKPDDIGIAQNLAIVRSARERILKTLADWRNRCAESRMMWLS